ncbi:MAG: hypothetical protein PWQ59_799 [Thermoanaerobacterium sp.]|jgi:hypothetical protein|nr:hypothetical protein [Thermoanaerobacterium sp.]
MQISPPNLKNSSTAKPQKAHIVSKGENTMARADLLKKLFSSFRQDDKETFYKIANEIIEDERKKNHGILADDLKMILFIGNSPVKRSTTAFIASTPKDADKKETGEDSEDDLEKLPNDYKVAFYPGYTEISSSTLQQRVWAKSARGGSDLLWNENDPYIYVLVTGKERFKYAEQELPQPYALVITFSYSGQEDIKLYEKLQSNVRIRDRQRERTRAQIRV